jgi:hypothetical protein
MLGCQQRGLRQAEHLKVIRVRVLQESDQGDPERPAQLHELVCGDPAPAAFEVRNLRW